MSHRKSFNNVTAKDKNLISWKKEIRGIAYFIPNLVKWTNLERTLTIEKTEWAFIFNGRNLGDYYVICSFLNQFSKLHNSKSITIVSNAKLAQIANLFSAVQKIVVIDDMPKGTYVNRLVLAINGFKSGTLIPVAFSVLSLEDQIKKRIHSYDLAKNFLQLPLNLLSPKPDKNWDGELKKIEELFNKANLRKGKTVIIAPYSNTVPQYTMDFWKRIVQLCKNAELDVATNISRGEKPIEGTEGLFFNLSDSIIITEYAGVFISIRSGLCDILSSSRAKKLILYPDKMYLEIFSISNKIEFVQSMWELIVKEDNVDMVKKLQQVILTLR